MSNGPEDDPHMRILTVWAAARAFDPPIIKSVLGGCFTALTSPTVFVMCHPAGVAASIASTRAFEKFLWHRIYRYIYLDSNKRGGAYTRVCSSLPHISGISKSSIVLNFS